VHSQMHNRHLQGNSTIVTYPAFGYFYYRWRWRWVCFKSEHWDTDSSYQVSVTSF